LPGRWAICLARLRPTNPRRTTSRWMASLPTRDGPCLPLTCDQADAPSAGKRCHVVLSGVQLLTDGQRDGRIVKRIEMQPGRAVVQQMLTEFGDEINAERSQGFAIIGKVSQAVHQPAGNFCTTHGGEP